MQKQCVHISNASKTFGVFHQNLSCIAVMYWSKINIQYISITKGFQTGFSAGWSLGLRELPSAYFVLGGVCDIF